jgi:hypothetical protein
LILGTSFAIGDNAPLADCLGAPLVRADTTWAGADLFFRWRYLRAEAEYVYQDAAQNRWGLSGTAGVYAIPDFLMLVFRAERVPDFWQWTGGLAIHYYGDKLMLQYAYTRRAVAGQASDSSAHMLVFTLAI